MAPGAGDPHWFEDRFTGPDLDPGTWSAHYLPAWSSRTRSRASYHLHNAALVLDIPVDHPLWCEGDHEPPLRVSVIQSGSWSGPAGSVRGQQRFREGQVVLEEQERFEGWLPSAEAGGARVEISARMDLSPRSMAALWMSGFEDDEAQERCGELCVFEVFGRAVGPPADPAADPAADHGADHRADHRADHWADHWAEVGVGIKAFRDPALTQDFAAPRVRIDVSQAHLYAVEWDATEAVFSVDGIVLRRCPRPPTYPLQLMLGVFDFPEWSVGEDDHLVPRLVVDRIAGTRP